MGCDRTPDITAGFGSFREEVKGHIQSILHWDKFLAGSKAKGGVMLMHEIAGFYSNLISLWRCALRALASSSIDQLGWELGTGLQDRDYYTGSRTD